MLPAHNFREDLAKSNFMYFSEDNHLHISLPLISGDRIGLDNTCQTMKSMESFFACFQRYSTEKARKAAQFSALNTLTQYKVALDYDIRLINNPNDKLQKEKTWRLTQVNYYIRALEKLRDHSELSEFGNRTPFPQPVQKVMKKAGNLYQGLFKPVYNDDYVHVVEPGFSLNRYRSPFQEALINSFEPLRTNNINSYPIGRQQAGMDVDTLRKKFIKAIADKINPEADQAINIHAIQSAMTDQMVKDFKKYEIYFTSGMEGLGSYRFALLTDMSDNPKLESGKMYFYKKDNQFKYKVIDDRNNIVGGDISSAQLQEILTQPRTSVPELDAKTNQLRSEFIPLMNNAELTVVNELPKANGMSANTLYICHEENGKFEFAAKTANGVKTGHVNKIALGRFLSSSAPPITAAQLGLFFPEIRQNLAQNQDRGFLNNQVTSKENMDDMIGEADETDPRLLVETYIIRLIKFCTGDFSGSDDDIFTTIVPPAPFYDLVTLIQKKHAEPAASPYAESTKQSEINKLNNKLSIATQFFMWHVNSYCIANELCEPNTNFGQILDANSILSNQVATAIKTALGTGASVEAALFKIVEGNKATFRFKAQKTLTQPMRDSIQEEFTSNFIAILESPHFDEFIKLDINHAGYCFAHQTRLCTDLATVMLEGFSGVTLESDLINYFKETSAHIVELTKKTREFPSENTHLFTKVKVDVPQSLKDLLIKCDNAQIKLQAIEQIALLLLSETENNQKAFQQLSKELIDLLVRSPHWREIKRVVDTTIRSGDRRAFNDKFLGDQPHFTLSIEMAKNLYAGSLQREGLQRGFNFQTEADLRRMITACGISDTNLTIETNEGAEGGFVLIGNQADIDAIRAQVANQRNKFYLTPAMVNSLYQEAHDRSLNNPVNAYHLENLSGQDKLIKALSIVGLMVKAQSINYPAHANKDPITSGCILSLAPEITRQLENIHEAQTRPTTTARVTPAYASSNASSSSASANNDLLPGYKFGDELFKQFLAEETQGMNPSTHKKSDDDSDPLIIVVNKNGYPAIMHGNHRMLIENGSIVVHKNDNGNMTELTGTARSEAIKNIRVQLEMHRNEKIMVAAITAYLAGYAQKKLISHLSTEPIFLNSDQTWVYCSPSRLHNKPFPFFANKNGYRIVVNDNVVVVHKNNTLVTDLTERQAALCSLSQHLPELKKYMEGLIPGIYAKPSTFTFN